MTTTHLNNRFRLKLPTLTQSTRADLGNSICIPYGSPWAAPTGAASRWDAASPRPLGLVRPARRTQDYWSPTPWCCRSNFGYQPRVPERFRESRSLRFFRPLLYQLSYLGESLILLGNSRADRTSARPMV